MKEIENLYKLYKNDIYSYLLSLTRDPTLSEDLLADTFVNAIRGISKFRGQSSVKTWLFTIARNCWLQRLRKEKITLEYNDLIENYVTESADEQLVTKEMLERLGSLLNEKDERTQTIVKMRIEGFSFSEISQTLGIAESSARVIDFRTKKWIRSILEKEGLV